MCPLGWHSRIFEFETREIIIWINQPASMSQNLAIIQCDFPPMLGASDACAAIRQIFDVPFPQRSTCDYMRQSGSVADE